MPSTRAVATQSLDGVARVAIQVAPRLDEKEAAIALALSSWRIGHNAIAYVRMQVAEIIAEYGRQLESQWEAYFMHNIDPEAAAARLEQARILVRRVYRFDQVTAS